MLLLFAVKKEKSDKKSELWKRKRIAWQIGWENR